MMKSHLYLSVAALAAGLATAYRVPIKDTDSLREVCSGMWGGTNAKIELSFDARSDGQVSLVIYEWNDVHYLGADTDATGDNPKTYICTTSAVRSGLCQNYELGSFITTLPEGKALDSTSIFTQALKFSTEDTSETQTDDLPGEEEGEPEFTTTNHNLPGNYQFGTKFGAPTATEEFGSVETGISAPDYIPVAAVEETEDQQADENLAEALDDVANPWERNVRKRHRVKRQTWDSIFGGSKTDEDTQDEPGPDSSEFGTVDDQPWTPAQGDDIMDDSAALYDSENHGLDDDLPGNDQGLEQGIPDQNNELADDQVSGQPGDEQDDSAADQGGDDLPLERPDQDNQDQDGQNQDDQNQDDQNQDDQAGQPVDDAPYESDPVSDPSPTSGGARIYTEPIFYSVRKTGYYCVGIVPVTLVEGRSNEERMLVERQSATHAEYSGIVTFHNTFDGELPAVEYPKINFYLFLSVVYFALGLGWAFLCVKHRDEILPMQYYISGTIGFLIIEMLANFAYYRYINKHGGGATSLAFLFVISILNAARNSLSFFLLLIVSMGLSVVRQSLGGVMNKVRILTGLHFVFGVLYSVGTVEVELESASLILIMFLIFPLAITLTAFLMWIIVSLNGTIMFLSAHKQRMKLQMFQRLWRILIMAVIAIAAFFVISSMSLSNRLDEDYAPKNWRYRWFLLDGSLALIYLAVFSAVSWIWRPTANNRSFSMSQELAQDEAEADADDYEFSNLDESRMNHQPLNQEDDYDHVNGENEYQKYGRTPGQKRGVGEENTVFALDDSEDEASDDGKGFSAKKHGEYRDDESDYEEDKKRRD